MGRVRTTLELGYKDEVRDLQVTFDVIDSVRSQVPWEELAVEFDKPKPVPNFTMMAKFVYYNLKAAGFKITKDDLSEIYDEILSSDERDSYIQLVGQLLAAYMPQGKKKATPAPATKRVTKKAS